MHSRYVTRTKAARTKTAGMSTRGRSVNVRLGNEGGGSLSGSEYFAPPSACAKLRMQCKTNHRPTALESTGLPKPVASAACVPCECMPLIYGVCCAGKSCHQKSLCAGSRKIQRWSMLMLSSTSVSPVSYCRCHRRLYSWDGHQRANTWSSSWSSWSSSIACRDPGVSGARRR